jgi:hypothetical protein
MSKQHEALELALEALDSDNPDIMLRASISIREALAEPEPEQKPVAWMYHGILHTGTPHDRPSLIWRPEYMDAMSASMGAKATPLYTAPPQRKPLTEPELNAIEPTWPCDWKYEEVLAFARAIERAHGIGD